MPAKFIKGFSYREFEVKIAETGPGDFKAVGYERDQALVEEASGNSVEDVEFEIKERLKQRSGTYVGIEEAVSLFLKAFPEGFSDPFYKVWERDYKDKAAAFVADQFSEDRLESALERGQFEDVCMWTRQAISRTNLLSPFEMSALSECHKKERNREPFAEGVYQLLYGNDFGQALNHIVHILKPHNAAKWPVVTYLPYFRFPDRHMFLKPEVTKDCADRLGFELDYDATPNIETYNSLIELVSFIRHGIARLGPKDNIDIQSMIWVVGNEGYVAEAVNAREATC